MNTWKPTDASRRTSGRKMKNEKRSIFPAVLALALGVLTPLPTSAQGTPRDYARSDSVRDLLAGKIVGAVDGVTWSEGTRHFWYRRSAPGGYEFVLVDADAREKRPAFDHARLAAVLSSALDTAYTALTLPFDEIELLDGERTLRFTARGGVWRCTLADYGCSRTGDAPRRGFFGGGGGGAFGQQRADSVVSPDGAWVASIRNFNVAVRPTHDRDAEWRILSEDGSEGNAYGLRSLVWSPDSRRVAVYRTRPGYRRIVRYVESSPDDQIQPEYMERVYAKPGDALDVDEPVLFDVASGREQTVDAALFPNAYSMGRLEWRDDGRRLTFEYNQRGHQVYRVIEVDAETGAARALISEEPETFYAYRDLNGNFNDHGTHYRYDVHGGDEILWASERDGWRHLYMYDGRTGRVERQVTKGPWVVSHVDSVDEAHGQIWFRALGMNADQDPYFQHWYRVDFDGSHLVAFTKENGTHTVTWSPDHTLYVDEWSRVDLPPVTVLKRASDQQVVMSIEEADASALLATGWRYPEVFKAKGRDGKTDIWGIIVRPMKLDPNGHYPVVESIYAGPQGSFVPKSFSTQTGFQSLAELGFIVAQIDGMGTNNRSKAFHDVAWKNLGDAGFPDRILWHRAVAARYPWYDITRVGIYGTSAGGQNALGALLFHSDFYDAAVSAAGSHDNRMDKMWWNEQYMGWPLGPHYSASSNVDNAWRLQGDLLLIVGELDTNVDPSTTLQVVDRLIAAKKYFDLLVIPGAGHTNGGAYGIVKRNDFFVQHLLGVEPPRRNADDATQRRASSDGGR